MYELLLLMFNLVIVLGTAYCIVHIANKRVGKKDLVDQLEEHMKSDRIFNAVTGANKRKDKDK